MRCNSLRRATRSSVCALLISVSAAAVGQTIGDYSRAQSAVLEHSMAQVIGQPLLDNARSNPDSATSARPGPASSGPPHPPPPPSPSDHARTSMSTRGVEEILVTGVFATKTRAMAEVIVDGIPYWLCEGDAVPHTPWHLSRVQADRVELERVRSTPVRRMATGVQASRIVDLPRTN